MSDSQLLTAPLLSDHFRLREPSAIRVASIRFAGRQDGTQAVNVAIGNVSLPMHPAMVERMNGLGRSASPFAHGVVKYTATVGTSECCQAFLNIIESSGFGTEDLCCQVCDGGSQAMELVILGVCGPAGSQERPLMLIDAAYTNYLAFAARVGRSTVSIQRTLQEDGHYSLPSLDEIEKVIIEQKPGGLVVIPYDNPTGHLYDHGTLVQLARLCVKHNLWLISDEAYRELFYTGGKPVSVWGISEAEVPGITGRRISIETASKVWNACGLRIGGLVTDNRDFHVQAVAENTANLCSSAIGQHIFAGLAEIPHSELQQWYEQQRSYYSAMLHHFTDHTKKHLPGVIVSSPDAAIYSTIDVRNVAKPGFDSMAFVLYCAEKGSVLLEDEPWTLLTAPMGGFYSVAPGQPNPGSTQLRVAYVETPKKMQQVPALFAELFRQFEAQR